METNEALKTAHIHLEFAMFRVHVNDSSKFDIEAMNENKPDFVNFISRSNDKAQQATTLLVDVVDGYDLEKLADWIAENEKQ